MATNKLINREEFLNYMYLDDTSPSGLRWAVYRNGNCKKDSIAGCKNVRGYWQVRLNASQYYAHRVVWALTFDDPGDLVINHIDGNTSNNALDNIEACLPIENARKQKGITGTGLNITNTSGITGVREIKAHGTSYQAMCSYRDLITHKIKNRSFSYTKYGILEAWAMAVQLRKDMEQEALNALY